MSTGATGIKGIWLAGLNKTDRSLLQPHLTCLSFLFKLPPFFPISGLFLHIIIWKIFHEYMTSCFASGSVSETVNPTRYLIVLCSFRKRPSDLWTQVFRCSVGNLNCLIVDKTLVCISPPGCRFCLVHPPWRLTKSQSMKKAASKQFKGFRKGEIILLLCTIVSKPESLFKVRRTDAWIIYFTGAVKKKPSVRNLTNVIFSRTPPLMTTFYSFIGSKTITNNVQECRI